MPITVIQVIKNLRELGQPVTLFGENPADRRDRLREVLAHSELQKEEEHKVG